MRTPFDLLARENVRKAQERQKNYFHGNRDLQLNERENVVARNYSVRGDKWTEAQVRKQICPVTYSLQTPHNEIMKRHIDQIKPMGSFQRIEDKRQNDRVIDMPQCNAFRDDQSQSKIAVSPNVRQSLENSEPVDLESSVAINNKASHNCNSQDGGLPLRRSTRIIRKPDRLDL